MFWQAHFSESRKEMPAAEGISPDLLIMLYEVPGESISFGRGQAQRSRRTAGIRPELAWPNPTTPGDTLRVEGEVVGTALR
jgi:hypothetical protein